MPRKATPTSKDAKYLFELEPTLCNLAAHSHLTMSFIEDILNHYGRPHPKENKAKLYEMSEMDCAAILYGIYELDKKITDLKASYYARPNEEAEEEALPPASLKAAA